MPGRFFRFLLYAIKYIIVPPAVIQPGFLFGKMHKKQGLSFTLKNIDFR